MLYEFDIMSASLPDMMEPIMTPMYTSKSSSLSFDVPSYPKYKRLEGINVTFKYSISGDDMTWFCKVSTTNGVVDLMYNPKVFGKPELGEVCIWLSYWPIGYTLNVGDTCNVSVVVMSGLEVHECGVSLVYSDQETLENYRGREEILGGDLSGFELSTGAYYLCRRDFFELMEVGRLTPDWFRILVGDTIDSTEVRGWRKTGRPKQLNSSFTELKTIRCIIHGPELDDIYNLAEMVKSSIGDKTMALKSSLLEEESSEEIKSLPSPQEIYDKHEIKSAGHETVGDLISTFSDLTIKESDRYSHDQKEDEGTSNAFDHDDNEIKSNSPSNDELKDMAERLPVGLARDIKSPSFTSFGSNLSSSDVLLNASVDQPKGQTTSYKEADLSGPNTPLELTIGNQSLGQSKAVQPEATTGNSSRSKDNEDEWVEQDEPGVYVTLTSLPGGVKDLKRVRFSRKRFSEKQAEQWWSENRARVYQRYNLKDMAERLPVGLAQDIKSPSFTSFGSNLSSGDVLLNASVDQLKGQTASYKEADLSGPNTPLELTIGNQSLGQSKAVQPEATTGNSSRSKDGEDEWIEEDEPGVYITLTSLPGGINSIKRVRFSRKRFSAKQAEQWWSKNQARVYQRYNVRTVDKSSLGVSSDDLAQ